MARKKMLRKNEPPTNGRQQRFEEKLLEDPGTAVRLAWAAQKQFDKRLREEPIRKWFPQFMKEAFELLDDENLRQVALPIWERLRDTKYLSSPKAKRVYDALIDKWHAEARVKPIDR